MRGKHMRARRLSTSRRPRHPDSSPTTAPARPRADRLRLRDATVSAAATRRRQLESISRQRQRQRCADRAGADHDRIVHAVTVHRAPSASRGTVAAKAHAAHATTQPAAAARDRARESRGSAALAVAANRWQSAAPASLIAMVPSRIVARRWRNRASMDAAPGSQPRLCASRQASRPRSAHRAGQD